MPLRSCISILLLTVLSAAAAAKNCNPNHAVYGLIGNQWRAMGASDGPLGCPTSEEMDHREGKGRYQTFEHGSIAWSPGVWPSSVQVAYQAGNQIHFEWTNTSPLNYDVFLVHWSKDGADIGGNDVNNQPRTSGSFNIPLSGPGVYRIVVEGCDRHTLSSSTCRQGWTLPVYVSVAPPPPPSTAGCSKALPVYGLIGNQWAAMGGVHSPLGCPITPEMDAKEGKGRVQTFEHGQITWSPNVWPSSVQAAYVTGNQIVVEWTNTSPFNYDAFLIHQDRDGNDMGGPNIDGGPRTSGRFAFTVTDGGTYRFAIEGCDRHFASSSTCRQGWTNPLYVNYTPPSPVPTSGAVFTHRPVPSAKDCTRFRAPLPGGLILREWMRLGGPNGPMGCPVSALNRHPDGSTDGGYVQFENGAISVSPDKWPKGVWGAYQDGDHFFIDWTTAFYDEDAVNYDKFLLHWDDGQGYADGVDILQDMEKLPQNVIATLSYREDTHLRKNGIYDDPLGKMHPGRYTLDIEGCDMPSTINPFDHSHCRQGWLHPLPVEFRSPVPDVGMFNYGDFTRINPATSIQESKASFDDRLAALIFKRACQPLPYTLYRNEENGTEILIAKLAFADYFQSDRCPGTDTDLRAEANAWIMKQTPQSHTGTSNDSIPFRTGELDVALNGMMPVIFKLYHTLTPEAANHIIDTFLNRRGPMDPGDLHVFNVVPESENHLNMTETARYLTNQILFQRTHNPQFDNRANGFSQWWLQRLHGFLKNDFIEFNAHPYTGYTTAALQNLYSYSSDAQVKEAARMVLDYLSAKIAVSSINARRSTPYRRKSTDYTEFLVDHPDPNMLRTMMLAGNTEMLGDAFGAPCRTVSSNSFSYPSPVPFDPNPRPWCWPAMKVPPHFIWEMLMAGISDYRIPDPILDLIVNRDHHTFYQGFHHAGEELYASSNSYLISAGGRYAGYAYSVNTPVGDKGKDDDIGLVVPTTFMPYGAYTDRSSMVRFKGDPPATLALKDGLPPNNSNRYNLCVAPDFACGLNPEIPGTYTDPNSYIKPQQTGNVNLCVDHQGKWWFFNRSGPICGHLPYTLRLCGGLGAVVKQSPVSAAPWLKPSAPGVRNQIQTTDSAAKVFAQPEAGSDAPYASHCKLPGYYLAVYQDGDFGLLEAYDTYLDGRTLSFDQFKAQVVKNNPRPFNRNAQNTYLTVTGKQIQFYVAPQSRIVSVTGSVSTPNSPRFLWGDVMNSNGDGLITILNPYTRQQATLNDTDAGKPLYSAWVANQMPVAREKSVTSSVKNSLPKPSPTTRKIKTAPTAK